MNKKKTLVAIMAMSASLMGYSAMSPILAKLQTSFPQCGLSEIQIVYTIASLVALPMILLTGRLAALFPKKPLGIAGVLIMMVGGLIPVAFHTHIWMLYVSSAIVGMGMGLGNVVACTLISDNFKGYEKGRIMGYQGSVICLGGALFSAISGAIAEVNWVYSYGVFILLLPCAVLAMLYLPASPKDAYAGKKQPAPFNTRLFGLAFMNFAYCTFLNAFSTNISMLVEEYRFGGPAQAGMANSIFLLIGIPGGMMVGGILRKMGRDILSSMTFCTMLGFFVAAYAPNIWFVYLGAGLVGFGFATRTPAGVTFAANMAPGNESMGIAVSSALGSLGTFLSPFVVNGVAGLFGGGVRATFLVCAAALAVCGCIYHFLNPVRHEEVATAA